MKTFLLFGLCCIFTGIALANPKESLDGYWVYDGETIKEIQKPFLDALQKVPKDKRQKAEQLMTPVIQYYSMMVLCTKDLKSTYYHGDKTQELNLKLISEKENLLTIEADHTTFTITVEKDKLTYMVNGVKTVYIRASKEKALKMIEAGNKIAAVINKQKQ